jgi:GNAT superfamily N-acetyltransferase
VVEVRRENCSVLEPGFNYTREHIEDIQPCLAKIIQGRAVALCRTVRRTAFALEAGVDTIPEFRGKGFGKATVMAWASQVWSEGLVPCYSTQSGNEASLALASKAGMIQYAVDIIVVDHQGS